MRGLNKTQIIGSVGKDPELRATQSGTVVANFTVAVNDREKDQTGNWVEVTEWFNLVAFARTAEVVRDYVKKGTSVYVEGKTKTRSWDDKQSGEKKYRAEILVNELLLLGTKPEGESGGAPARTSGSSRPAPASNQRTRTPAPTATRTPPTASKDPFDDTFLDDSDVPF